MTLETQEQSITDYLKCYPTLSKNFSRDKKYLAEYRDKGNLLIKTYEQNVKENKLQQKNIDMVKFACRKLRKEFIKNHAEWFENHFFPSLNQHMYLSEIAFEIASMIPGLVPSREDMLNESSLEQNKKEGFEFEQAVFFSEIFAQPNLGNLLINFMLKPTVKAQELLKEFDSKLKLNLDKISIEVKNEVAHINFLNSNCLNAEDNDLIKDLEIAVDLVLLSKKVKVGLLRGGVVKHPKYKNKRIFSAGINLKHISQGKISFCDFILGRELGYIHKILRGLNIESPLNEGDRIYLEKPWVSAVETFAIGGGMQLILATDYIIATQGSYVSLPAAKEGIIPGLSNLRLCNTVPGRMAKQIILHGKAISTQDPGAEFIFDSIVNEEVIDEEIDNVTLLMKSKSVISNRKMLHLSQEPMNLYREYMSDFSIEQARRMYSEDVLNKVARF